MKISIIVPVYNKEDYLTECVESVLKQTFTNWELILVDDESPDKCPEMCDEYSRNDQRIKVIHQKNKGHSEARNVGIRASTGEYLMFLDADDYLYDNYVLQEMKHLAEKEDLDICLSEIATLSTNGKIRNTTYTCRNIEFEKMSGKDALCQMISTRQYHATMCSRLFKSSLIKDNSLFFKKLICDDEEWTPHIMCKADKVGFLNKNCYVIRKLDNSVTGSKDIKTYIKKIHDKIETSLLLMDSFTNYDLTKNQKSILYNKFFTFLNMSFYSYFHDLGNTEDPSLRNYLIQYYKKAKKYFNLFSLKNKLKYIYIGIVLTLKNKG